MDQPEPISALAGLEIGAGPAARPRAGVVRSDRVNLCLHAPTIDDVAAVALGTTPAAETRWLVDRDLLRAVELRASGRGRMGRGSCRYERVAPPSPVGLWGSGCPDVGLVGARSLG